VLEGSECLEGYHEVQCLQHHDVQCRPESTGVFMGIEADPQQHMSSYLLW
jgi:hypothetical protein